MTFDAMSNSPSHSQLNTRKFWKEDLVIYQRSLKTFLQVPLQLHDQGLYLTGYYHFELIKVKLSMTQI